MSFNQVNQTTGELTQLSPLFSGITSVSVNGVAQTITSGAVDLDVASNLITEAQWTNVQAILN